MNYLSPWFMAMSDSIVAFKIVMLELGVSFNEDWALKESVVRVVNQICNTELEQAQIWQAVYDSRKSLDSKYNFLFPSDPEFQRKRTWCHLCEAWYAIALMCVKQGCLHRWLCHFNLSDAYDLIKAKQIVFNGEVVVNGLHIEGTGVISL